MKHLCLGWSGKAVPYYRLQAPPWGQRAYVGKFEDDFIRFVESEGLDWDIVHTNAWFDAGRAAAEMFRERGAVIVADVDDLFEQVPKGNQSHVGWNGENKLRYRKLLESADRRTASTPLLAERYDALITPNFMDPALWDWPERGTKRAEECVMVVPAGSGRAEDYLALERPVKAFLGLPGTKVVFMGWMPEWALMYPAGKVVSCRWVPFEEYRRMMRWIAPDIVVSPMLHNEFNVAKSNLKWLEAGMCGAAFVGERWGEYARTVNDGTTGVLAEGEAEWTEALMGLALNAETRQHVAEAGRAEVLRNWTWDAVAPQWRKAVLGEA